MLNALGLWCVGPVAYRPVRAVGDLAPRLDAHGRAPRPSLFVELRTDDQGFTEWDGTLVAAGWVHCPCTPERLGTIPKPTSKHPAAWSAFFLLIDERYQYAARRSLPLKANGDIRWECPVAQGKIGCTRIEGSTQAAFVMGLPIVANPPLGEDAPAICRQASVGMRVTSDKQKSLMKVHQKHYWGSPPQVRLNNRRTYVEGSFGVLKGDSAARQKRGSSQHTGLVHVVLDA